MAHAGGPLARSRAGAGAQGRLSQINHHALDGRRPSQLETFDPHPGKKIAGGQAIGTAVKGIQIAADLPQTAEVMDEMTLVVGG